MFVLDVPENDGLVRVAEQDPLLGVEKVGPYFRIVASGVTAATPAPEDGPLGAGRTSGPGEIVIDRRATGCRHAVWYSGVAGLERARIAQHDKNALRVVAGAEEER
ncbi:hypothetical protein [Pseudonocardia sp. NPDC046786]|uniref:hypothetical protein n=1 Tax=Pseudonocardia sp. NPDC046786 TaxID=3155471 RepID=UPI0033EA1217